MGALEQVAAAAGIPKLHIPLAQMTAEVQFENLMLAEQEATTTMLERTYVPDWVVETGKDEKLLDSQRFVLERIRDKAEYVAKASLTGNPYIASQYALRIPADVVNDLLWFALLSSRHGLVPWSYALGRNGRTPELDKEFTLRLGLLQAVKAMAESPIAAPLKKERDARLGIAGLGAAALGIAPLVVAGVVIAIAAVALIAALAYIVVHGYEVYQFNQRWTKWCTDPKMLGDPSIKKWCAESGKPPPAADPESWKTQAVWAGAGILAVVLGVQFLPQIVGKVKKARSA